MDDVATRVDVERHDDRVRIVDDSNRVLRLPTPPVGALAISQYGVDADARAVSASATATEPCTARQPC